MLILEPVRDTIFIGHATPHDNEFTIWLGLQLANNGYKVWSDLLQLVGGDDFWRDIEAALRTRTAKHLYVLSTTSNHASGCLKELSISTSVAKKHHLQNFVIPIRIDTLPFDDMNIELHRDHTIDASTSWADALHQLLDTLHREHVPRTANQYDTVNQYWRNQFSTTHSLQNEPEQHLTNFFPSSSPENVYVHTIRKGRPRAHAGLPWPSITHDNALVSFAPAQDLGINPISTRTFAFDNYQRARTADFDVKPWHASRHLVDLLRQTWERHVKTTGLRTYEMANKTLAAYHEREHERGREIPYHDLLGKKTTRGVVGYKTMQDGHKRYYHVAISAHAKLDPVGYRIITHVLFSDDGTTVWSNHKAMQKARRSQCWDWWNDDWRDRLLASVQHLGATMSLNCTEHLTFSTTPTLIDAPVRFDDPPKRSDEPEDDDE